MSFIVLLKVLAGLPIELIQTVEGRNIFDMLVKISQNEFEKSEDKKRKSRKSLIVGSIIE